MPKNHRPVYGHTITPPRITRTGIKVAIIRVGLPFVAALAMLDLILWGIARALGGCYGVWCWL